MSKVGHNKRSLVREYFDRGTGADVSVYKGDIKTLAGNTTDLHGHLSCKHCDAYDEMTDKALTVEAEVEKRGLV